MTPTPPPSQPAAEDEAAFSARWLAHRYQIVAWAVVLVHSAVHLGLVLSARVLFTETFWSIIYACAAVAALLTAQLLLRPRLLGPQLTATAHLLVTNVLFATVTYFNLRDQSSSAADIVSGWTAFCGAAFFSVLALPYWDKRIYAFAVVPGLLALFAWSPRPLAIGVGWLYIAQLAFIVYLKHGLAGYASRTAKLRFESDRLAVIDADVRRERELLVARRVHESLLATETVRHRSWTVRFPAGDQAFSAWQAHVTEGDTCMVIAARAAGSTLEAALVLHAVQALWARTERWAAVDLARWVQGLDRVLARFGESSGPRVELALLRVESDALVLACGGCRAKLEDGDGRARLTRVLETATPSGRQSWPLLAAAPRLSQATVTSRASDEALLVLTRQSLEL